MYYKKLTSGTIKLIPIFHAKCKMRPGMEHQQKSGDIDRHKGVYVYTRLVAKPPETGTVLY
jgi:hypothetical protein